MTISCVKKLWGYKKETQVSKTGIKEAIAVLKERAKTILDEAKEISQGMTEIKAIVNEAQSLLGPAPQSIAEKLKQDPNYVPKETLNPKLIFTYKGKKMSCALECTPREACMEEDCQHCGDEKAPHGTADCDYEAVE